MGVPGERIEGPAAPLNGGMIRAVTFDAGHTLIEPRESVGEVYATVAAQHGAADLPAGELERRFHAALHARGSAVSRREDWARIVDDTFAGLLTIPPSNTFFPELFERFGRAPAWRIYADVLPTLEMLAQRGARLGLISNWDDRLRPLLAELRLTKWFEVIVISCEVGCAKPAPGIFAAAAQAFGLPTAEILHVGDNWLADVAGARAAGFQAVQIARDLAPGPDRIDRLVELRHWLELGKE